MLRGLLPAVFAIAMGWLVGTIQRGGRSCGAARRWSASCLCSCRCSRPFITRSEPISAAGPRPGSTTSSPPPASGRQGWGTWKNPELTSDLTMARDFDLGISGPPLFISMGFIASGLVEMVGGLASAVVLAAYAWWAPFLLAGAWLATHWLLARERRLARPQYRSGSRRPAPCRLRLPARRRSAGRQGAAALWTSDWVVDRFRIAPPYLADLLWQATRLRERPVLWSLLLVLAANIVVFWSLGSAAADGRLDLGRLITFATAAVSTSMIAFGGLSWALDGAAAPAAAVLRLQPAMETAGALEQGTRSAAAMPAREIRFRNVTFALSARERAGARGIRPDHSRRIVAGDRRPERSGQDHARQAALPAL